MFDNEKQVEQLIEQLKETDEQFAVAMTNKKKSMQGFMQYFFQCAQAAYIKAIGKHNGYMSGIDESDVRSLMIHYWTEDNPKVGDIELGTAKFAKVSAVKSDKPKATKAAPATPKGKVPAKANDNDDDAPSATMTAESADAPTKTTAAPAKAAPKAKAPITSTGSAQAPAPAATKVVPMAAAPAPVVGFCDDDDF